MTIWVAVVLTLYTGWQYYVGGSEPCRVRVEVVAVGTELLLGQIPDTNSQWLGERLAANGISSHFHQHVGDNHERIVFAFRTALARSDAVIVCGGLGPTQDDITRAALAEVMNVPLERDESLVAVIRGDFASRGRPMPDNNLLQADVPRGATMIPQTRGTAPGLIGSLGQKVVYAVPGVPYEMSDMFDRAILPDLLDRQRRAGETAVIQQSGAAHVGRQRVRSRRGGGERFDALEGRRSGHHRVPRLGHRRHQGPPDRDVGDDDAATRSLLDEEESGARLVTERFGDIIFGSTTNPWRTLSPGRSRAGGRTLAVAESLTGGLIASRLVNVAGASAWFRGGVVSYDSR